MSFLWSFFLYLLLLIPLIIVAYIFILRRRRRFAIRYSSLSLVREAMSHQSWLRRHLSFILFLLALASLILAFARPVAMVSVPSNRATIILAMDVSRSMCSTDVPPSRLEAAKSAALAFIHKQVHGRHIGIVAFAGFAELVQPPTDDQSLLENAINNLTTARRTAIGSAILRSLDAIAEIDNHIKSSDNPDGTTTNPATPMPKGEYAPHIVILLTDGANNAGPDPIEAAQQAIDRGIRVYTIGFGTTNPSAPMNCGAQFQGNDQFGGGGGGGFISPFDGGGGFRRGIDEQTLTSIADTTGGKYYAASSAGELNNAFQDLPTYLTVTQEETEIGAYFTAFAALLAVIAMILSLRWHPLS
jgi:Ca-activated chloride channel family protein